MPGEAMATVVPAVVTDLGESTAVVGDTGNVVPPANSAALAATGRRLLEAGREGRGQLGARARQRLDEFALGRIAVRKASVYTDVLAGSAWPGYPPRQPQKHGRRVK